MGLIIYRARSPFALSLVFGLSLVSIFVVFQSAVSSQRLTDQKITDHKRSRSSFIQKQNESSAARDERRRAAHKFDLLKRAASAASEISDASYQAARDRLCRIPEMTAKLDQASEGDGRHARWMNLGPEGRHTQKDAINPCRTESRDGWRSPLAGNGDEMVFYHGAVSTDGKSFFGGTAWHGILRGTDSGVWQSLLDGTGGFVAVNLSDAETVFAARSGLSLSKSLDGGRTFVEAGQGIDDIGLLIAPFTMDAIAPQRLWTGGRSLWRTSDGAARWERASAEIAGSKQSLVSAIAVAPVNSNLVLAGTSEGLIYRSREALASGAETEWPSVQPRAGFVSSLSFDPHDPNIAYATYSTFGGAHVWRSADGGANWTAIDGAGEFGLPDLPVHTLVVDPRDSLRLYIGTDLGVFTTDDGGQRWIWERAGFGDAAVESLVLHRGDDQISLFAFTRGRGVWRLALGPDQTCGFAITPTSQTFEAEGGTENIFVAAASGCSWTATSSANWITIDSGGSGGGLGTVTYTVAANTTDTARAAKITVAGRDVEIEQAGAGGTCAVKPIASGQTVAGTLRLSDCISRALGGRPGNRYSFEANAGELAAITVQSNIFSPYLTLFGPNGSVIAQNVNDRGEGTVRIPDGLGRFPLPATGTYIIEVTSRLNPIGSYTLLLDMAASNCAAAGLLPTTQSFDPAGGEGRINVAMGNGCLWSAVSSDSWISFPSGASGEGSTYLFYSVAKNTSDYYRTGTITVAGQTFTVEQAGAGGNCLPIPITAGQVVSGVLNAADCRSLVKVGQSIPYFSDRYAFEAAAGQQIAIVASSPEITPALTLFDPGGRPVADTLTRLPSDNGFFNVTKSGVYTFEIREFRPSENTSRTPASYSVGLNLGSPGCAYRLAQERQLFNGAGGTGSVNLTASDGCAWAVTNTASWITIDSGESGTGSGPVNFTVAANQGNSPRSVTLLIAGQTLMIEQAGMDGTCAITPISSGQPVSGNLRPTDCRSRLRGNGSHFANRYSFRSSRGSILTINVEPTGFTPYIYLIGPNGEVVAETEGDRLPAAGPGAFMEPQNTFTLPSSGDYQIEITSSNALQSGPYTLVLNLMPQGCVYLVKAGDLRFEAAGGMGSVEMAVRQFCPWKAVSTADWITIDSGEGAGPGEVKFTVAANTSGVSRIGRIFVAGQSVIIRQAAANGRCAPVPLPSGQVNGHLSRADCRSRSDPRSFAHSYVFSGLAGERIALDTSGADSVELSVLDGPVLAQSVGRIPAGGGFYTLPKSGAYLIEIKDFSEADYTLILTKLAPGCAYSVLGNRRFDPGPVTGSLDVRTSDGCQWQAASLTSWITIRSGASGAGNGTVEFELARNPGPLARFGEILVAGELIQIVQAGPGRSCNPIPITPGQPVHKLFDGSSCPSPRTLSRTDRFSFSATAGDRITINLAVFHPAGVSPYTITVLDPNGAVVAESREDTLIGVPLRGVGRLPDGNELLTLPLSGTYIIELTPSGYSAYDLLLSFISTGCVYRITPSTQAIGVAGGAGRIDVSAAHGCAWTARTFDDWLRIDSGASGEGDGSIVFTAARGDSIARHGSIFVAGQTIIVDQGNCAPLPIRPGETINGRFDDLDCPSRQPWIKLPFTRPPRGNYYSFEYTLGQQLSISFNGDASTALSIFDPDGNIVFRSRGGTPFFSLPKSGAYLIELSSQSSTSYTIGLNAATGCAYTFLPFSGLFDPPGGEGEFDIITDNDCSWTAADPSQGWARITSAKTGQGPGKISYTVDANPDNAFPRGTSINISGASSNSQFQILQAGRLGSCLPISIAHGQTVRGSVSNNDCLVGTGPIDGSGRGDTYSFSGEVGQRVRFMLGNTAFPQYMMLLAPSGEVLTISSERRLPAPGEFFVLPATGDYRLTVSNRNSSTQYGDYSLQFDLLPADCGYILNPDRQQFEAARATGRVDVTTTGNCSWTARSDADWITINAGASGTGPGATSFTVATNNSLNARSGTIIVAGRIITIEQAGLAGTCAVTPITSGQTVRGQFTTSDCRSSVRPFGDNRQKRYSFNGEEGQQVTLSVIGSNSLLVTLFGPSGQAIAPTHRNSPTYTLPADGTYVINVTGLPNNEFTLNFSLFPAGCGVALDSTVQRFNLAGGQGVINVVSPEGCAWSVSGNASWITINSGASGSGNARVNFTVAINETGAYRSSEIIIGRQKVLIEQAGIGGTCLVTPITPGPLIRGTLSTTDCFATGSTTLFADRYSFAGRARERVQITVSTETFTPLITLFDPSGIVIAQVEGSRLPAGGTLFTPLLETGTYSIEISSRTRSTGDYTLSLANISLICGYALLRGDRAFDSEGGQDAVTVSTDDLCLWNATSNAPWIRIFTSQGGGTGGTSYTVAPNNTPTSRTGTIAISGLTAVIEQAGVGGNCVPRDIRSGRTINSNLTAADCSPRRSIAGADVAERYFFNATAGQHILIEVAVPNANPPSNLKPVITVFDPAERILARSTTLRLPANNGLLTLPAAGTYVIEVAGAAAAGNPDYSISLATAPANCGYTLVPDRQSFNRQGGQGTINVTASDGCPWTAAASASWIEIDPGASGSGSGVVRFSVEDVGFGSSSYRTGKITIGGQDFMIEQSGSGSETCLPKPLVPGIDERGFIRNADDCPSRIRTDAFYTANRWSFTAREGERFAISLRNGLSTSRLHISLLDPDGRILTQAAMGQNEGMLRVPPGDGFFFAPVAGTYVIEVTPLVAGAGGDYYLRVDFEHRIASGRSIK